MEHAEHFDYFRQVVLPFINFALFVTAGFIFFRKPLQRKAQAQREEFLKRSEEANRVKKQAEASLKELEQRIGNFDKELRQIHDSTQQVARMQADQILKQAQGLSQGLIKEARATIEAETAQAMEKLKLTIADQVRSDMQARIAREFDEHKQQDLVTRQAKTLPSELRS